MYASVFLLCAYTHASGQLCITLILSIFIPYEYFNHDIKAVSCDYLGLGPVQHEPIQTCVIVD